MKLKLLNSSGTFILRGTQMPRHIQVAWGRHVFKLLHAPRHSGQPRHSLWLRDLPLNLADLSSNYGFHHAQLAYRAECRRTSIIPEI